MSAVSSRSDLINFGLLLWARKRLVISLAIGAAVLAGVWAMLIAPVYRAEVVVAPAVAEDRGSLSALGGQLGGLAALAGMELPGQSSKDEVIVFLKSRAIGEEFIRRKNLLPVLFFDRWDPASRRWRKREPTLGDAYLLFNEQIRSVLEDKRTGVVTIRMEWTDRKLVADWANGLVQLANERLKQRALTEANNRLEFLKQEAEHAETLELKDSIFRLIEAEVKSRMMATVQQDFAVRVLDPAVVPDADKRVRPWRSLMVLAGLMAGALVAVLSILVSGRLLERRLAAACM